MTRVTQLTSLLGAKRIGLLRELVPKADLIAVLINPTFPVSPAQLKDAQVAATTVGVRTPSPSIVHSYCRCSCLRKLASQLRRTR
jgi:hypothetical protein